MSKSYEYVNGYIQILLRSDPVSGQIHYCGGANIKRFFPITRETHGLYSNPAFRGVQLLRSKTVVPLVLDSGGEAKSEAAPPCEPVSDSDGWFRETLDLNGLPSDFPERAGPVLVRSLVGLILEVSRPEQKLPEDLSNPADLERFLDGLASNK